MLKIYFYCRDELTTTINVNFKERKVTAVNHTDNLFHTAFGVHTSPSWEVFQDFLQSRCFSKERRDCRQLLEQLGLLEYDPLAICEKTNGRVDGDFFSMCFEWN